LRWKAKRPRFSQGEPPTITTIENATPLTLPRTTRNGVPIYSVLAVLAISLLAFLQVSNGSATVLSWFVNLITASQLINYSVTCATFLCWRRALRAQNINRDSLPYKAIMQPGAAYLGMICTMVMAFVGGYPVFLPGQWDVPTFLFSYFMIGMFPILFFGWRLLKGNQAKWRKPEEVDLKGEVAEIDEYTRNYVPTPPRYVLVCLFVVMDTNCWTGMLSISGLTLSLEVEHWLECVCEDVKDYPRFMHNALKHVIRLALVAPAVVFSFTSVKM
jgi:hypothetical protein